MAIKKIEKTRPMYKVFYLRNVKNTTEIENILNDKTVIPGEVVSVSIDTLNSTNVLITYIVNEQPSNKNSVK